MFLLMLVKQIHIVTGKAAKGADKGFPCVGLPYVDMTPILGTPLPYYIGGRLSFSGQKPLPFLALHS